MISEKIRNTVNGWLRKLSAEDLTEEAFKAGCEELLDAADQVEHLEDQPVDAGRRFVPREGCMMDHGVIDLATARAHKNVRRRPSPYVVQPPMPPEGPGRAS